MRIASIILLLLGLCQVLQAQDERTYIRQGNELYQQGKYKEAAAKYAKALELKKDYLAAYLNQGNTYYQQDSTDAAIKQYELAANLATDKNLKAQAYHNLGNTYLKAGKYEESVEAYKNALRNNPNDADTRYNLAYAQSKLATQPPKDQDKQPQNPDTEKDDSDDKKSGQNNDKQQKNDQTKDEQGEKNDKSNDPKDGNKGNPEDAEKPKDKQDEKDMKPPKPGEMSKADLEKLLDALKNEEIKVQDKLQKKEREENEKTTIEKDW